MCRLFFFVIMLLFCLSVFSQTAYFSTSFDEFSLKGRVKQIEEFMQRFNLEEEWDGSAMRQGHDETYLKKYLMTLFDRDVFFKGGGMNPIVMEFVDDIFKNHCRISYEDSTWIAVAKCNMVLSGEPKALTLYLTTHRKAPNEYVWIIRDVTGNVLNNVDSMDVNQLTSLYKPFISPVEHEVGFIGLLSMTYKGCNLQDMFLPYGLNNRLMKLRDMLQTGKLKFKTIANVSFIFQNIPGWEFVVSRKEKKDSSNTGWLIRSLTKL